MSMLSLFDLLINTIESSVIVLFVFHYLNRKDASTIGAQIVLIIFSTIGLTIVARYIQYENVLIAISVLILFFTARMFTQNNALECFFASCLPYLLISMINDPLICLSYMISDFSLFDIGFKTEAEYYLLAVASKLIFALVAYIIIRIRRQYKSELQVKEAVELNLIIILILTIYLLIEPAIYQRIIASSTGFIVSILFIILIMSVLGTFFNDLKTKDKMLKEEQEKIMLQAEVRRYSDIKELNHEAVVIRHNMNHVLDSVKINIEQQNYKDALGIIQKYHEQLQQIKKIVITADPILDYHINRLITFCNQNRIDVKCNINLTSRINMNDDELSVILGNIFDNACENTLSETGKISIDITEANEYIRISVTNKKLKEQQKEDPKYHGIGLKTVKQLVEKNNGIVSFKKDNDMFECMLLLSNRSI